MDRAKAYKLLTTYLKNKNLIKHCLACEAGMKAIYKKINTDFDATEEIKWGITGLLHDIDYELAQNTNQLDKHGILIFEQEPNIIPEDIANAIKSHNPAASNIQPQTKMEWGIYCLDQLTGLIVAAALIHPDKKLAPLTTDFILKRMKEKSFARGARREMILFCDEKLGIPLQEFVSLALSAMQGINDQLGL